MDYRMFTQCVAWFEHITAAPVERNLVRQLVNAIHILEETKHLLVVLPLHDHRREEVMQNLVYFRQTMLVYGTSRDFEKLEWEVAIVDPYYEEMGVLTRNADDFNEGYHDWKKGFPRLLILVSSRSVSIDSIIFSNVVLLL